MLSLLVSLLLLGGGETTPAEAESPTGLPLRGEEAELFLETAKVVDISEFETKGITKPRRVTLSDGSRTLRAVFKDVNRILPREKDNRGRTLIGLRDSYQHEIAAYELDKLLGLGIVPPCVERKIGRSTGALCLWVEGAMTEWQRSQIDKIEPPDPADWNNQMYLIRLFHQLTWDTDYNNVSNILVDGEWQLYKIDSSRAFRSDSDLRRPESLRRFSRRIIDALRGLELEELEEAMKPWLDRKQIRALAARCEVVVELADREIAARGEEAVLYP